MNSSGKSITVRIPSFVKISIKPKQIFRILFYIGLAFVLIRLQETLILLFISFIIMAATKPAALYLTRKLRIPEGLAITSIFIFVFFLIFLAIYMISKPLADEFSTLAIGAPQVTGNLVKWISDLPYVSNYVDRTQLNDFFNGILGNFIDQFNSILNAFGSAILGAFRGLVLTLFITIFSIYLFLERNEFKAFLIRLFEFDEAKFNVAYETIESQLGAWVRGQLFLGFSVGILTYIGLVVLNIPYALPLSILAGVLEIVPIIGPMITAVIVTLVGLSVSPLVGLFGFILGVIIQQLENNFLVPVIMKRAVGMSPVVTIIALLVGQELLGLLGAFIAIPFTAMVVVILTTYLDSRDNKLLKKKARRKLSTK